MWSSASLPEKSERAAASAPGGSVVRSKGRFPVCGGAKRGRPTSVRSDQCRTAKRRRKRVDDLALREASLTRALTRERALRGTQAGAERGREGGGA